MAFTEEQVAAFRALTEAFKNGQAVLVESRLDGTGEAIAVIAIRVDDKLAPLARLCTEPGWAREPVPDAAVLRIADRVVGLNKLLNPALMRQCARILVNARTAPVWEVIGAAVGTEEADETYGRIKAEVVVPNLTAMNFATGQTNTPAGLTNAIIDGFSRLPSQIIRQLAEEK